MTIKKVKNSVTKWKDFNDFESNKQQNQFDLDSFLGIDTSQAVQSAYNDRINSEQGKLWSTRNTEDGESERLGMLKSNSDFAKKQVEKNFAKINTPFPTEEAKNSTTSKKRNFLDVASDFIIGGTDEDGNDKFAKLFGAKWNKKYNSSDDIPNQSISDIGKDDNIFVKSFKQGNEKAKRDKTIIADENSKRDNFVQDYVSKYGYLPKGASKEEENAYYNRFSQEYGLRDKNSTDDVFDKSRVLSTVSNAIAPNNYDAMDMLIQQNAQNQGSKVGNALTGLAGNMVGLAMNPGGGLANGKNLLNVTDDLAEGVASKVAPKLGNNLAGKLGTQAVRGAVDGGIGGALDTLRGNDIENLGSNVATGALGGAMLFGGGKALKEGSNAINSKLTSSALDSVDGMFNIKSVDGDGVDRSIKDNNPGINNSTSTIETKAEQIKANNVDSGIHGSSNMSVNDTPLNDVVKTNSEIAATDLSNTKKSRHATETMQNSDNITDDVKNQLNKYDFEYETVTNQGDYNNAVEFVKKANAKDEYMRSSGTSSQDTANGIALIQKLQADGDIESLIDVTSKLTTDLSKAGQTIQAARILNGLTPEGKLVYAQRQINKAADDILKGDPATKFKIDKDISTIDGLLKNKELTKEQKLKELDKLFKERKKSKNKTQLERLNQLVELDAFDSKYKDLIYDKYGIPTLSVDDANFVRDKMNMYQNSTNDREKEILLGQVQKLIGDKIPSKMMDKIDSFRYLNMLFNPKTLIKNAGGNAINTLVGIGRDFIGSGIDKAIGTKTGLRTTSGFNVGAWGKGAKKGLSNTLEDSKLGIDTSFGAIKEGARGNALRDIPVLGKAEEMLGTGLQLGDRPFYEGAKNNYIANYMKLNGIDDITNVPANVIEEAHNVGLEATYQQKTALGNFISNGKNSDNKALSTIVKTLLPFSQTPSAILDTAINYTPVGAVKGVSKLNKLLKNTDVDNALSLQRKGVNELASGIVGTGLIGAGVGLGNSGLMTGELSSDKETAALQRQTGMQPYALKIGDTYNDLSFAQPGASPLMMGADISQNGINKDTLGVGLNSIMNNSYLSGVKDLFGAVNTSDWSSVIPTLLGNYAGQLAPFGSLASNINKTIDPTVRDTYSNDFVEKNVKRIMSKYPGLSQMLPQATDTIGEGKEYNEGFGVLGGAVNNFINPLNTTKFTPSEVEQNALDMYNEDGSTVQIPRYAPKTISYGKGKQYTPTAEENRLFNSMIASALKNAKETPEDYQKAMTKAAAEWREKIKSKNKLK